MSVTVHKKRAKLKTDLPVVFIDGVKVEIRSHPGRSSVPVSVLRKAVQMVKAQKAGLQTV
jgi:hypothetical protein